MAEEEEFEGEDLAAAWGEALEEQGAENAQSLTAQWSSLMDSDEDATKQNSDRLEVVFNRLVRLSTTSLRNLTSDNVEVSLDSISSVRFGDYLNSIPLPSILSIFKAEEWNNFGLLTTDSPLIYTIVDVLLGGGSAGAARVEGRPYTAIELGLVQQAVCSSHSSSQCCGPCSVAH